MTELPDLTALTELSMSIRRAAPAELPLVVSIDDDAAALYARAGFPLDIGPDHPFARAEQRRWQASLDAGAVFFAESAGSDAAAALGVLVMGRVDGAPYLDQLAVRTSAMRRGVGRRLVEHAITWAGREEPGHPLWLTTYGHLPWNRPFYERLGFVPVAPVDCPPELTAVLDEQRRYLPAPDQRIAMRRPS